MYHILFIDEDRDDTNDFLDYMEDSDDNDLLQVTTEFPLPTIEEMVEHILDSKVDAIVVDFELNEKKTSITYNVPYKGVNVIEEILKIKEGFPCFLMTSYDSEAIKISQDVNLVYQKDILHNSDEDDINKRDNFSDRVIQQIGHYKARLTDAQKKFHALLEKAKDSTLNASEESDLQRLDNFLESAANKHNAIPQAIKDKSFKNDLHKLIQNTEKLLKKFQ